MFLTFWLTLAKAFHQMEMLAEKKIVFHSYTHKMNQKKKDKKKQF